LGRVDHAAESEGAVMPFQMCLLCGGDASDKKHKATCIGARPPEPEPKQRHKPRPVPPPNAEPYTNPGKGTVLENATVADRLAALFDDRAYWTSKELNDRLGWQFSQAVFSLRRRGMTIQTLRIGPRAFAYQRIAS
jgi:hypothetical protein